MSGQKESCLSSFLNRTLVPLLLLTLIPQSVLYLWYIAAHCDGSFVKFGEVVQQNGIGAVWSSVSLSNWKVYKGIAYFSLFQLLLMRLLPGDTVYGTETPSGHLPEYKDNGFACYVVTMLAFVASSYWLKQQGATPTVVYDLFGDFLASMIVMSLAFCLLLYIKGRVAPSTQDSGHTGNFIFDYYWGTELYPRILGFDVKVFTNCRFGLTIWALAVAIFAMKSYELHSGMVDGVAVTTILQLLYLTKFFWWEAGYYKTIDIIVDRAGYYICWGCLCFVPSLYTLASFFMVQHPEPIGQAWTAALLLLGCLSLTLNYWADWQKQAARATDGKINIWGSPARLIRAKYQLQDGQQRQSLLLASGFWGVSRHFHYIPELCLALCWCSVCGSGFHLMPYLYFIFLTALLFHRSVRDDMKCREKYGKYWAEYCKLVPYKIIPYVF